MKLSDIGEFGLINIIRRKIGRVRAIQGIGDDTAVLSFTKGRFLLFTTDMLMEGVHFNLLMPPQKIGYKAMACNISDIAAMGGRPTFAVVSLGVDKNFSVQFVEQIYEGMQRICQKFGVSIVGGDTVKSKKLIINVAMLGEVRKKALVTRSGAKVGDQIFVTGALGNSFKSRWHLRFTPRVHEAAWLMKHSEPHAMIDISDGLIADLGHILKESKVGAQLYQKGLPMRSGVSLSQVFYEGEDFELLFTVSKEEAKRLKNAPYPFFHIGEITKRRNKIFVVNTKGQSGEVLKKGFVHF